MTRTSIAVIALATACGRIGFEDAETPAARTCPTHDAIPGYPRRVLLVEEPAASWDEAFAACEDANARLLVPLAPDELAAILEAFGDRMWIGLTDAAEEGTFIAPAAAPLETPYFDWLDNEPNSNGDEDCVTLYAAGYNDEGCQTPRRYVCECDVIGP